MIMQIIVGRFSHSKAIVSELTGAEEVIVLTINLPLEKCENCLGLVVSHFDVMEVRCPHNIVQTLKICWHS